MVELKARCLCGNVRVEVDGDVISAGHCHCESCRRTASSPVTTYFTVRKSDARITGETLSRYQSSPGIMRSFCGNCGSPMAFEGYRRPDEIDFYVASLETGYSVEIREHWHYGEHVDWLTVADDLPKREG